MNFKETSSIVCVTIQFECTLTKKFVSKIELLLYMISTLPTKGCLSYLNAVQLSSALYSFAVSFFLMFICSGVNRQLQMYVVLKKLQARRLAWQFVQIQ